MNLSIKTVDEHFFADMPYKMNELSFVERVSFLRLGWVWDHLLEWPRWRWSG